MSKSTTNTEFRKVDVDQFDEGTYEEDAVIDEGGTGPNDAEVQGLLNKGSLSEALQCVLSNAPVTSKNQAVKDKAAQVVMKVLVAFKSADIEKAIQKLDQAKLDVLMKYIYRGFEMSSDGNGYGAQLLVWHDKVVAVTGVGSIVRVLTDRKRV